MLQADAPPRCLGADIDLVPACKVLGDPSAEEPVRAVCGPGPMACHSVDAGPPGVPCVAAAARWSLAACSAWGPCLGKSAHAADSRRFQTGPELAHGRALARPASGGRSGCGQSLVRARARYTAAMITSTDTPVNRPDITIFHNNRCSNSRGALALLRERGIEPNIVDYLATPLTAPELAELVAHLGVPVRDVLRSKEPRFKELGLDDAAVSDVQLIQAVAAHPVLLNRPIVVTPKGARLCRPPELVLELI